MPSLRRTFVAAFVAAVVGLGWGAAFWNLLPAATWVVEPLPEAEVLVPLLQEHIGESGVFMYPFLFAPSGDADVEDLERHADRGRMGPLVQLSYSNEGIDLASPMLPVSTFLHTLAAALLVAFLLRVLVPHLRTFAARLSVPVAFGLFGALYSDLGTAVWWNQPWSIHLLKGAFEVVTWLLMGLVLAAVVRPPKPKVIAGFAPPPEPTP